MIEVIVKTEYRVSCDRCGKATADAYCMMTNAKTAAEKEGFIISCWMLDGCARESMFCKRCAELKKTDKQGTKA